MKQLSAFFIDSIIMHMQKISKLLNNYVFNIVLIVTIAVLVIWLTFKNNPIDIIAVIQSANHFWFFVVILVVLLSRIMVGIALTIECKLSNPEYKYRYGIINAFVGSFFNNITPSASGGQFVQVFIFRKQGVPISSSASVLWMDFIIYQTTMVVSVFILMLLKLPLFYSKYSSFFIIVAFAFVVNSAVILGLWVLVSFPKFYTWIATKGIEIVVKMKLVKDPVKATESLKKQLNRFEGEVKIIKEHKEMIPKVVLLNVVRLLLYYSVPFFIALALRLPVNFDILINIIALSSFVSLVNAFIPSPGSSGGTEASFLLMFSTIFGKAYASSIMIIWRFATYYMMLVIGGLVFLYAKTRKDIPIKEES